ncbi:MAG: hypothetical protein L0H75_10505, partial [Nitrosospira sp.]|nr:hypothetical protein [Nitrosospira sp.]
AGTRATLRHGLNLRLIMAWFGIVFGELAGAVKNRQSAVAVAMHPDLNLDIMHPVARGWELEFAPFKGHAVIRSDSALEVLTEHLVKGDAQ